MEHRASYNIEVRARRCDNSCGGKYAWGIMKGQLVHYQDKINIPTNLYLYVKKKYFFMITRFNILKKNFDIFILVMS